MYPYDSSGVRQCQHASWERGPTVVGASSTLCHVMHARALLLDESSGTVVQDPPTQTFTHVDFASEDQLYGKLDQFIHDWNHHARPFNWSIKSVAKIMATAPALAA